MAVTHRLNGPGWSTESHAGEYTASQSKGHRPSSQCHVPLSFSLGQGCRARLTSLTPHCISTDLFTSFSWMSRCSCARVKKLFPWSFQSFVKNYLLLPEEKRLRAWASVGHWPQTSVLTKECSGSWPHTGLMELFFFSEQLLVEALYLLLRGMKVLKSFSPRSHWQCFQETANLHCPI